MLSYYVSLLCILLCQPIMHIIMPAYYAYYYASLLCILLCQPIMHIIMPAYYAYYYASMFDASLMV